MREAGKKKHVRFFSAESGIAALCGGANVVGQLSFFLQVQRSTVIMTAKSKSKSKIDSKTRSSPPPALPPASPSASKFDDLSQEQQSTAQSSTPHPPGSGSSTTKAKVAQKAPEQGKWTSEVTEYLEKSLIEYMDLEPFFEEFYNRFPGFKKHSEKNEEVCAQCFFHFPS